MQPKKYKIQVVRGAFWDTSLLERFGAKVIEKFERTQWQSLDEVIVNLDEVKILQKNMTHHYDDTEVPWYMDGHEVENKKNMIVVFGADDGEGGRIFEFTRSDQKAVDEVVAHATKKGIPKEELDFWNWK